MRKIRVRVSGGVPYTPLVQWIERETSKLIMRVQFLQGVPIWRSGRALQPLDRRFNPDPNFHVNILIYKKEKLL